MGWGAEVARLHDVMQVQIVLRCEPDTARGLRAFLREHAEVVRVVVQGAVVVRHEKALACRQAWSFARVL